MELIDLFIGSEGTLAVFSEIGIRLIPAPSLVGVLTFFPSRKQAFAFADFLRKLKNVAAIEYFDETALTFINQNRDKAPAMLPEFPAGARAALYWEYSETDLEPFESSTDAIEAALIANGSSFESSWSGIDRKESSLLKAFRHSVPECINQLIASYKALYPVIRKIGTDAALPGPAFEPVFETFLKLTTASKINTVIFGHIGDFHLHWNMLPKVPAEFEKAVEIYTVMMDCVISSGGTVSAEHGIGKLKVDYLAKMYGKDAMEEMKRIKEVFDPFRLLNPGNLFVYD
jgi:D-lactate dehydrogenase (cytochrome)